MYRLSLTFVAGFVLLSACARKPLFGAVWNVCSTDCPMAVFVLPEEPTTEMICDAFGWDLSCLLDCGPANQVVDMDDAGCDVDDEPYICPDTGKPLCPNFYLSPDVSLEEFYSALCKATPCIGEDEDGFVDPAYYCAHQSECIDAMLFLYGDVMGATDEEGVCFLTAIDETVSCDEGARKLDNAPMVRFPRLSMDLKKIIHG
mmetsp:Transcript_15769/g.23178  ORF Transcript_15769/g.23178 Transcript_15769/m.23178 type:complete len:202 (-) Transcript_15769:254-859(-)